MRPWLTLIQAFFVVLVVDAASPARGEEPVRVAVVAEPKSGSGWDLSLAAALLLPGLKTAEWALKPSSEGHASLAGLRKLAASGRYDAVWLHSHAPEKVATLMDEGHGVLFVVSGSSNKPLGRDQLWVMKRLHEPAYLLGVAAGLETTSGVIGVVAGFPLEDVNDAVNAFAAGARAARADVKVKIRYIRTWSNAAKAGAATNAMADAGADVFFQMAPAPGVCAARRLLCFGAFLRGDGQGGAALASWAPDLARIVAAVRRRRADPKAALEPGPIWIGLKDGGADVHLDAGAVSAATRARVLALRDEIRAGVRTVKLDMSTPRGD